MQILIINIDVIMQVTMSRLCLIHEWLDCLSMLLQFWPRRASNVRYRMVFSVIL